MHVRIRAVSEIEFWGKKVVINAFSLYYSCKIPQNDFSHFASKSQEDFKPYFYKWPWHRFLGVKKRFLRSLVKLGFKISRSFLVKLEKEDLVIYRLCKIHHRLNLYSSCNIWTVWWYVITHNFTHFERLHIKIIPMSIHIVLFILTKNIPMSIHIGNQNYSNVYPHRVVSFNQNYSNVLPPTLCP